MTTRRTFLKSLAFLQPLILGHTALASTANATGRIALVVGNNAYRQAPLVNPVSDARAMGELFSKAGFAVDLVLDAPQASLAAAFGRFAASAGHSEIREAVFYYAGHGAQLDWRNYLLPVDAVIGSPDDLKNQCLDLNHALAKLPRGENKMFLFILDACRNNPFGQNYRPSQNGLSQFDAPPGTLLAYATGPGRVASDGTGEHGLYTEKLIQELTTPGIPIEESLKRVRLNVRLASQGEQIPWESTSLESNVVLFRSEKVKAEPSQALQLEEEIEHWNRIKSSRQADDWIAYLRRYPNGKFAEIAQVRLDELMAPVKAASPGNTGQNQSLMLPNPYSAGRYPLGRRYTVGDKASFRIVNLHTREGTGTERHMTVTKVDLEAQRVELNTGSIIWDLMGNPIQPGKNRKFDIPAQYYPSELYIGKKWASLVHKSDSDDEITEIHLDLAVLAKEKIVVPAGEFDCFRIEGKGWNSKDVRLKHTYWIAPGINFFIRREILRKKNGRTWNRWELTALKQEGHTRPA
jgi:hypothetical protein